MKSSVGVPIAATALRAAAETTEDGLKDRYYESVIDGLCRRPLLSATIS